MGKSPNKHNKLWITIQKLPEEIIEAIKSGKLSEMQSRDDRVKLLKSFGWDTDDAKNVVAIEGYNVLVNRIKGRQYVDEVMDHIKSGFREAVAHQRLSKGAGLRIESKP